MRELAGDDGNTFIAGYKYNFSKRTQAFVNVANRNKVWQNAAVVAAGGKANKSSTGFGAGLQHNFCSCVGLSRHLFSGKKRCLRVALFHWWQPIPKGICVSFKPHLYPEQVNVSGFPVGLIPNTARISPVSFV